MHARHRCSGQKYLVAMGAEPLARLIVELVLEAHSNAVAVVCPAAVRTGDVEGKSRQGREGMRGCQSLQACNRCTVPELFHKAVFQLHLPLAGEEVHDGLPP
jgi:hypothetical protein